MFTIVGELINGTRNAVREAIADRNVEEIRRLGRRQADAGAQVIDLNAGESAERELEDLLWLIETVEAELGGGTQLAIDTSSPGVMAKAIAACSLPPVINSISNEAAKKELIDVAAESDCDVIGLAMGEAGMPQTSEDRVSETGALVEKCERAGIPLDRLYVDLICMSVAASQGQGRELLDAVRAVRERFPVKTLVAVSNVSFGLPDRRALNRTFLAMLVEAGLDAAILDPTDAETRMALCAARALVGADSYCMDYIRNHRARTSG